MPTGHESVGGFSVVELKIPEIYWYDGKAVCLSPAV